MRNLLILLALAAGFMCSACTQYADSDTRAAIQAAFPGAPIMVAVANCESRMRQFNADGTVIHGVQHRQDSGLLQINKSVHAPKAKELGINLDTTEGNLAFGRYLYDHYGLTPWASSRGCWGRSRIASQ